MANRVPHGSPRLALAALALALALAGSSGAEAPDDTTAWKGLVCGWVDSLPWAELRALAGDGARLTEILSRPAARACHANALLALGIAAPPGAYEAIADYDWQALTGEVDRATFRARTALPTALGHLARTDDRALRDLIAAARGSDAPAWSYRTLGGERLALELRQGALNGLALSGRPAAGALLAELGGGGGQSAADVDFERHRAAARALHARVAQEGADAVFGVAAPGGPR